MSKLCSVCHTDNKDEAQFCRSCGTSFAASPPTIAAPLASAADGNSDNICGECGFQNKPGIRYCANCGMSLTTAASGFGDLASKAAPAPAGDPYAGLNPPPITYTSFPPVAPYPPAPAEAASEPSPFDELMPPDIPDADAEIAARQHIAPGNYAPPIESGFSSLEAVAPAPNRARMVIIGVVLALIVAGAAAWWFMGSATSSRTESAAAPASQPVAAPAPVFVASAPEPMIIEAAPASAPASAPAVEAAASVPAPPVASPAAPTVTAAPPSTPPAAAAPMPQQTEVAPVDNAVDAKRIAADKARREKIARDKADRDAKAKALADQRDQAAASARADQEAQARRRTEEAQRARAAAVVPAPVAAPVAQPKGVREACAGRGTIAEAVCQSRQCAAPEHANEAICRQIREADDRRRNYQN